LRTDGSNLGLDALLERVADDPDLVAPVVATWPLTRDDVRIVPLRPTPLYPWHAVWRTGDPHPALAGLLRAVEAAGQTPETTADTWLPRAARDG
jgi:hypothetical protein